jgi:hypothetical protein
MDAADAVRLANRSMIAFDLALGTAALAAPDATLRAIGHDAPSEDARWLFRRCGPIWLTYAAAHTAAAVRGDERDWAGVAWLRATEILTDVVWSRSPAVRRPLAREGLIAAGVFNLALAGGAAMLARRARAEGRA